MEHHGEHSGEGPPRDYPADDNHPSLVWLKEQWAAGNTKKLEEMVELWETFELMGRIGKALRKLVIILGKILVWFAGLVAAYWVVAEGLTKINQGGK
jgi:hypothetical protein